MYNLKEFTRSSKLFSYFSSKNKIYSDNSDANTLVNKKCDNKRRNAKTHAEINRDLIMIDYKQYHKENRNLPKINDCDIVPFDNNIVKYSRYLAKEQHYIQDTKHFVEESIRVATYHKGIEIPLPIYNHISDCENQLMDEFDILDQQKEQEREMTQEFEEMREMRMQLGDVVDSNSESHFNKLLRHIASSLKGVALSTEHTWILSQMENLMILLSFAKKCESVSDYMVMTQMAYKLFVGESLGVLAINKINSIFKPEVQSFDVGETLKVLRSAFDTVSKISDCELGKKLVSLYSFLLTQGFLRKFGLQLSDEDYSKMEQRAMLSAFSSKKAFYVCVVDVTLFMCEKFHEFKTTGDITNFVHSGVEYNLWIKESDRILNLAPFTGNLQAHNTSYFSFLADLRAAIEKGEAYAKHVKSVSGVDSALIKKKLSNLHLLQNTEITRRAAQKERAAPMGVLLHGSSSIAKSAFSKMLFHYYGALFKLDRDDHFRYVRNPMDEYWSNFDSSKWCIQLDDIAFLNPGKCPEVDATLKDLLNVINNVPYVPPQAALEDKGKTPVMAKLVIATSNCADLHAQEYFWCPLAVRRRLPFVVNIKPKQEYLHDNQVFIDPLKITTEIGRFPNLWDIEVQKVSPVLQGNRELASLDTVKKYDDVNEFLQAFGQACKEHEKNQARALTKDKDMHTIDVCQSCYKPLPHDDCLSLQYGNNVVTRFVKNSFMHTINWIISFQSVLNLLLWASYYRSFRWIISHCMNYITNVEAHVYYFTSLSSRLEDPRFRRMLICGTLMLTAITTYMCFFRGEKKEEKKEVKIQSEEQKVQQSNSNTHGVTENQLAKEQKQNVWYNPRIELTSFDVPLASASLASATPHEVRDLFDKNCVLLEIRVPGENMRRTMRGVFIKGHYCVTNGHAFKNGHTDYTVDIILTNSQAAINSNVRISLSRSDISFSSSNDVCVFEVSSIPPFKDISKFWNNLHINPTSAIELTRSYDGTLDMKSIFAINFMENLEVNALSRNYNVHVGTSSDITQEGDCGSLCIAMTPRGPIIIGLHFLGKDNNIGILDVKLSEIDLLMLADCFNKRPIIQGGNAPELSCNDKTNLVIEPHYKSIFRYLESATVNVYGSFTGFRCKPKSNVCATPLSEEFLAHFNVANNYGQPCMIGWEPWRKNVIEMVKPKINYNKKFLKECVRSFTSDIINGLPQGWQQELLVLSNKASVNGLPGVIYIDKIATTTSMGFPWSCPKKKYLIDAKDEIYPDGVDFPQEIWDRVEVIEEKYRSGQRCYPVFVGHLKDEATPLNKCKIKKTRMFTGAPIDWSLVVRKNLLSFIRLLQKNKFVFEAGPGTVTQSSEWGMIYKYLTAFGTDQIVAGDYGKFDKRMIADFILAAYEIIVNVHRAAGFTEEQCRTIMCIGEDTAFPVTNVNGDLVEFFGTNPSGHPLTVIINSLVNSLYMRYCYISLNPQKEVLTFKNNVRLFTYGDDNIMGVNPVASWFNHTAIQNQLQLIGVEYTMADKESESVPFINISNVSFLKRQWRWNDDINNWAAPLEEASIIKSLTMWVPSKTVDKYKQMVDVISSANSEFFFHGREIFELQHLKFKQVLEREPYTFYVNESTLPTYDMLVQRFLKASEPYECQNSDS